jgi:RNA polymerase sigma-70 factor (ECF subfamily)
MEEFTYKEIAAALSLPLGTVMSHVHRARAKLREQLSAMAVELGWAREEF